MLVSFLIATAYAQNASSSNGGSFMSKFDVMAFLPMILIFGVFYIFIIRPQQKKAQRHTQSLAQMKKGDRVITAGGIVATVIDARQDKHVRVEISPGVRITVLRSTIGQILKAEDAIAQIKNHKSTSENEEHEQVELANAISESDVENSDELHDHEPSSKDNAPRSRRRNSYGTHRKNRSSKVNE